MEEVQVFTKGLNVKKVSMVVNMNADEKVTIILKAV
jgi:hypothetical protein